MTSFDPAKNRNNLAKHKVELSAAERFDWETCVSFEDDSEAYGEHRECAIGFIGEKIYFYVYTLRGEEDHAISLRPATKQEIRYYVQNR